MACTFSPTYGSGVPCSGQGVCVNTSNIAWPQLCRCDWAQVVPSDLFDMRVDPGDPSLAMDCSTPRLGIQILAALLLASVCVRIYFNVKAVRLRIARGHWPKRLWDLVGVSTNRILVMDVVLTTPLLAAWPVLKLTTNEVVSTDVAVTLCMVLGVLFTTVTHGDLQHQLFTALISGHFRNRTENARLLTMNRFLHAGITMCYFLLSVVPALVSLGVDKSLGPYQNGLLTILIIRNMGLIAWQVLALAAAGVTVREVQKLIASIGDVQSQDTKAVLDFVKHDEKTIGKKNLVAFVAYVIFSLPWLWPYQGIQMLLMAILASSGMMPGHTLYNTLVASAGKTSSALGHDHPSTVKSSTNANANHPPPANTSVVGSFVLSSPRAAGSVNPGE